MARETIRIETEELSRLELDFREAPGRMQRSANRTLDGKAGPMIAREMRVDATDHQGNWFGVPGTQYDTDLEKHVSHEMLDSWTVEVGIEAKGSGKLAHIIVYGSAKNAPVYDHMAGPRRALPRIEALLGDDAEDAVFGDPE